MSKRRRPSRKKKCFPTPVKPLALQPVPLLRRSEKWQLLCQLREQLNEDVIFYVGRLFLALYEKNMGYNMTSWFGTYPTIEWKEFDISAISFALLRQQFLASVCARINFDHANETYQIRRWNFDDYHVERSTTGRSLEISPDRTLMEVVCAAKQDFRGFNAASFNRQ